MAKFTLPTDIGVEIPLGIGVAGDDSLTRRLAAEEENITTFQQSMQMLQALREGRIGAAIRGELEAKEFLRSVKFIWRLDRIYRVAVLSTCWGRPFLFAPVGIDEGSDIEDRTRLIEYGRALLKEMGWKEGVGILAPGRKEDRDRDSSIAESIEEAERLAMESGGNIRYILIEEAAKLDQFILAPDGRTGNLIYRTLIHLGGGGSHGAVYFPMGEIIVDTSRSAPEFEYREAIKLARIIAHKRLRDRCKQP